MMIHQMKQSLYVPLWVALWFGFAFANASYRHSISLMVVTQILALALSFWGFANFKHWSFERATSDKPLAYPRSAGWSLQLIKVSAWEIALAPHIFFQLLTWALWNA